MPPSTIRGSTGSPVKVQLTSAILRAEWLQPIAAVGGSALIEVRTLHVADGSEIRIDVLDDQGGKVAGLTGTVFSGIHRRRFTIPETRSTLLLFTAKLPAHGVEATGSRLRVVPRVSFTAAQHEDAQGQAIKTVTDEAAVRTTWQTAGVPEGTSVDYTLHCLMPDRAEVPVWKGKGVVESGKATALWPPRLPAEETSVPHAHRKEQTGERYTSPRFRLVATCLGTSTPAPDLEYTSWMGIDFGNERGEFDLLLPDGTTRTLTIPDDGIAKVRGQTAGLVEMTRFEPASKGDPKPSTPMADEPGQSSNFSSKSFLPRGVPTEGIPVPSNPLTPPSAAPPAPSPDGLVASTPIVGQNIWKLPDAPRAQKPKRESDEEKMAAYEAQKLKVTLTPKVGPSLVDAVAAHPLTQQQRNLVEGLDVARSSFDRSMLALEPKGGYVYNGLRPRVPGGRPAPAFHPTPMHAAPPGTTGSPTGASPTPIRPFPTDRSKEWISRVVWRELTNEGSTSAINAYDGTRKLTWGQGFNSQGVLPEVLTEIFENPEVRRHFNAVGFDWSAGTARAVNPRTGNVERDADAWAVVQADAGFLAAFVDAAENQATGQVVTDAQWNVIQRRAGNVPDAIRTSWPESSIALVAHLVWWQSSPDWPSGAWPSSGDVPAILTYWFGRKAIVLPSGLRCIGLLPGQMPSGAKIYTSGALQNLNAWANRVGMEGLVSAGLSGPLALDPRLLSSDPKTPRDSRFATVFALSTEADGVFRFFPYAPNFKDGEAAPADAKLSTNATYLALRRIHSDPMQTLLGKLKQKTTKELETYRHDYLAVEGLANILRLRAFHAIDASLNLRAKVDADTRKRWFEQASVMALPYADKAALRTFLMGSSATQDSADDLAREGKYGDYCAEVHGREMRHLLQTLNRLQPSQLEAVDSAHWGAYGPRFGIAIDAVRLLKQGASQGDRWSFQQTRLDGLPDDQQARISSFLGLS